MWALHTRRRQAIGEPSPAVILRSRQPALLPLLIARQRLGLLAGSSDAQQDGALKSSLAESLGRDGFASCFEPRADNRRQL